MTTPKKTSAPKKTIKTKATLAKKPVPAKKASVAKTPATAKQPLAAKKPPAAKKPLAVKKTTVLKKVEKQTELAIIIKQLEALKAEDIETFEAEGKSYLFDQMVVCTSRSKAHGNSTLEKVREALKAHGFQPYAMEGDSDSEWRLLDAGSVIIHVMTREAREHFDLESLWGAAGAMRD